MTSLFIFNYRREDKTLKISEILTADGGATGVTAAGDGCASWVIVGELTDGFNELTLARGVINPSGC